MKTEQGCNFPRCEAEALSNGMCDLHKRVRIDPSYYEPNRVEPAQD